MAAHGGDPGPAQKNLTEHIADQAAFREEKLQPALDAAAAGNGHVFFVDATHLVFGTFLTYLWCFTRLFVRAASGRQRFNVLGAWNALTHELVSVTNTTSVNAETMCELLRKIADLKLTGPITLILDNARYPKCALVIDLAKQLSIHLEYLPSYSPNLNLIERLWKFLKRTTLRGHYYANFAEFKTAIESCLEQLPTTHKPELETLMTLNFQTFPNVSLTAA